MWFRICNLPVSSSNLEGRPWAGGCHDGKEGIFDLTCRQWSTEPTALTLNFVQGPGGKNSELHVIHEKLSMHFFKQIIQVDVLTINWTYYLRNNYDRAPASRLRFLFRPSPRRSSIQVDCQESRLKGIKKVKNRGRNFLNFDAFWFCRKTNLIII